VYDIISTIPYFCDDCDTWHLSHYWYYPDDGTYSECDSDGNHEDCDESDVPTAEQELQAWRDYYRYVAREGKDPVGQFSLPSSGKVSRRWQARVRNWIGAKTQGLKVSGVRRRGKGPWIDPKEAPSEVAEYISLTNKSCIDGFHSFDQLKDEAEPSVTVKIRNGIEARINFTVDEHLPEWSEKRISVWLKRKATEALMKSVGSK
jgi:hypothetical protein